MPAKAGILVTGAAGRTGSVTVRKLLEEGFPVRALVHREDARAKQLARAGAEVVRGDMFDFRDMQRALRGVQRAYHCPPFGPNLLHNAAVFALAAEEAKLEVVALMSQWLPNPADPSVVTREHWLANNLYRWMPSVDVVHINPGLFAFVYLLGLPAIYHLGLMAAPFGDGQNAPPSNEDIGRVAAAVLADPAPHIGKSYRPTGPDLLTPGQIAGILGQVLGRKVKYQDVPFRMFVKAGLALGFPLFELSQLRHYSEALRNGAFALGGPTDHVERLTGQKPETFTTIAQRYIAKPDMIHPLLKLGSKAGAFAFAARMMMQRAPDLDAYERQMMHPMLSKPDPAPGYSAWRASAEQQKLYLLGG